MSDTDAVWSSVSAVRERNPLVQCITNYVAMDVAANVLLAAGASPAMVHDQDEAGEFTAIADAVTINIGTLSAHWVKGMHAAIAGAKRHRKPWVLDPVGVGATRHRTEIARDLALAGPAVIRGNASEILALAGAADGVTRGVDSTHTSDQALDAAAALARETGSIVAVTGAVDRVTDGNRVLSVENGHPLMTQVTALGCALTGLVGAYLAVRPDPLTATAHALAVFGLAGERAAATSEGPGSLRWRLLDELYGLDEAAVRQGVRLA
ncbi:hydroxyethylthiazole kinase [Marinivivus vitaminiproducens]|uniref:hydroxyethylthiazole kinase n=1 Tax=Marinivivus vitaminiproducens TaxID=3035935 RepID=UPI0027984280|nr:hydroxyethylthiazole kinase [Geminicoccaceae bacterium SCSIO 64248]